MPYALSVLASAPGGGQGDSSPHEPVHALVGEHTRMHNHLNPDPDPVPGSGCKGVMARLSTRVRNGGPRHGRPPHPTATSPAHA